MGDVRAGDGVSDRARCSPGAGRRDGAPPGSRAGCVAVTRTRVPSVRSVEPTPSACWERDSHGGATPPAPAVAGYRWTGARAPSAFTSTCRSARRGAATATSTPTPPRSSRAPARRRTGGWRRCAGSWQLARRDGRAAAVDTVFVGGGTPSLIGADRLGAVLDAIRRRSGWPTGPRSPPRPTPSRRRRSSSPGSSTPGSRGCRWACSRRRRTCCGCWTAATRRAGRSTAAREARAAGLAHVNLDLIYATPGETDADLRPRSTPSSTRGSTTCRRTR